MRNTTNRGLAGTRKAPLCPEIETTPAAERSAQAAHTAQVLKECLAAAEANRLVGAVILGVAPDGTETALLAGRYALGTEADAPQDARAEAIETLQNQLDELEDEIALQCVDEDTSEALLDLVGTVRETAMRLQFGMPAGATASATATQTQARDDQDR
jgi:hypothetical protein